MNTHMKRLRLGLLFVGVVATAVGCPRREEPVEATPPPAEAPLAAAPADAGAAVEPLTDVVIIVTTTDRATLLGRPVVLTNVQVQAVTGDKAFWVGPSKDQRLLAILEEVPTPGTPIEGRYNVQEGQLVTLRGELREAPAETLRTKYELGEAADLPEGPVLYMHVLSMEILAQDAGVPDAGVQDAGM